jgi:pyruvate formate lyase activating enzyme
LSISQRNSRTRSSPGLSYRSKGCEPGSPREKTSGIIFNIQGYSIHDGPGIRSLVFLKGCPLRCKWCDNPESQNPSIEVEFFEKKCIRCGTCLTVCERGAINPKVELSTPEDKIDRSTCDNCGKCAAACPVQSLRPIGEKLSLSQVMEEILRDAPYYRRSGGGVTLSGGEPLGQPEFSREILRECYNRNIHTALETSGYAPGRIYRRVIEFADLILYDVKHMEGKAHRELTGVPNEIIMDNLRDTVRLGKRVIVRVPLVPGYTDTANNVTAIGGLISGCGIQEIHLLPFHQLGRDKYRRLGLKYELGHLKSLSYEAPSIKQAQEILQKYGLRVQIGG